MKVFKFGGASLKSAAGIRNVGKIVSSTPAPLLIVVSAMGKTTDQLEKVQLAFTQGANFEVHLEESRKYHYEIISDLFEDRTKVIEAIDQVFTEIKACLNIEQDFDHVYDQVVSKGELISSLIVYHYMRTLSVPTLWLDARNYIATDKTYREGKVDWEKTKLAIQAISPSFSDQIVITQGFIGRTVEGATTTLGREGSDFSAAIFASCLQAESVTIWKDVPGVMNADPKRSKAAIVFKELPFKEAAEMTYYGASVIHPKTIKPLANHNIPLLVKNFEDPTLPGTIIHKCKVSDLPPLIVFKDNQCLVSCKVTDYSFINEQQLSFIFHTLTELDIRINVMQNSAISFSFCIDFRESKVKALIQMLQQHFEVYYNTGLTLITIKNYDQETFDAYRKKPGVLVEQSSRSTLQILLKM
jgi:aspartate kinase